jgi:hypothetical protein
MDQPKLVNDTFIFSVLICFDEPRRAGPDEQSILRKKLGRLPPNQSVIS